MNERTEDLLVRWVDGELSDDERKEMEGLLAASAELRETLADYLKIRRSLLALRRDFRPDVEQRLRETKRRRRRLRRVMRRWSYAAAVVLAAAVAGAFFLKRDLPQQSSLPAELAWGQMPVLVMPNGERRALPQNDTTVLWQEQEGDIHIDSRTLIMEGETGEEREPVYYTVNIPYGGEYNLVLPDGTRIYLNAGTTLRYPDHFAGGSREIFLSGEAYLEVSRDTSRPFIVRTDDMDVRVLGTVFNVNAYPDGNYVRTTLVEGKVETSCGGERIVMKPGTQVAYDKATRQADYFPVDVRHFISWKDGYYDFRDMTLGELMQIFVRWYDVDVRFANPLLENLRFSGRLRRYEDVSELFEQLEYTGDVAFDVKGKNIVIRDVQK